MSQEFSLCSIVVSDRNRPNQTVARSMFYTSVVSETTIELAEPALLSASPTQPNRVMNTRGLWTELIAQGASGRLAKVINRRQYSQVRYIYPHAKITMIPVAVTLRALHGPMNVVMHIKTSDKKTPTIGSTQLSLTNPPSAAKTTALDPPSRPGL